jgi:hypothetical protein
VKFREWLGDQADELVNEADEGEDVFGGLVVAQLLEKVALRNV